jgi:LysM domain
MSVFDTGRYVRPLGRVGRWPACRLPVVAAGVALLELALVGLAGAPARQLEVLRGLGEVGADPLASLLALLALAAEGLAAYLLLVVVLRAVALLPGAAGRLAGGATLLVAPATVRRALDVLVGGALLAQSTLAPLPRAGGAAPNPTRPVVASAAVGAQARAAVGRAAFVIQAVADPEGPEESRGGATDGWTLDGRTPVDRDGVAPVPLPPWLGGWQPAPRPRAVASDEPPPGPVASQSPPEGSGPEGSGAPLRGSPVSGARRGASVDQQGSLDPREGDPVGPEDRDAPEWREYTVRLHDTLWGIAAARLPAGSGSAATIDRYWRQVYAANRAAVGADPDLIHPGTRLAVPPYRPGGR